MIGGVSTPVAPASSANLNIVGGEEAELAVTLADPPTLVHLADTQDNRDNIFRRRKKQQRIFRKVWKDNIKKDYDQFNENTNWILGSY